MDDSSNFSFIPYVIDKATELKKFSEGLNICSSKALTQLQRLPITLRRRAASQNLKRLPFRFRKAATVCALKKKVRSCRKFRRRHMDVKAIYIARQNKNKWLYTHLWHAKRFRIENKWGWKVPIVPNQKTFRPCTKAMLSGSAIIDLTYHNNYELYGCQTKIVAGLKRLINITESEDILQQILNGREVYTIFYKCDQYPYEAICPLKLIMLSDKKISILITMHPAGSLDVVASLSEALSLQDRRNGCWANVSNDVVLVDRSGENCRFRLIGVDSHRILTTLLSDSPSIANLQEWPLTQIISGYSVEALVDNPELTKPKLKETDAQPWLQYPWRKSNELPSIEVTESYFQIPENVCKKMLDGETIPVDNLKHLAKIADGEKCPIRLLRHKYGGNSPGGWDVIVPAKWAIKLWVTLIMKGCRPMGLKYLSRFCAVESSSLVSKYDCYPMYGWTDTVQGSIAAAERGEQAMCAWGRRPPAKRINYELQGTSHPFTCPYQSLFDDINRKWFILRETIKLDRVANRLLKGEIRGGLHQLDHWDPELRYALVPVMIESVRRQVESCAVIMCAVTGDTDDTLLEQASMEPLRHVIGYVDIADQSMIIGRGKGSGLVSMHRLVSLSTVRPSNLNLFWIKNPSQQRLFPVRLTAAF